MACLVALNRAGMDMDISRSDGVRIDFVVADVDAVVLQCDSWAAANVTLMTSISERMCQHPSSHSQV